MARFQGKRHLGTALFLLLRSFPAPAAGLGSLAWPRPSKLPRLTLGSANLLRNPLTGERAQLSRGSPGAWLGRGLAVTAGRCTPMWTYVSPGAAPQRRPLRPESHAAPARGRAREEGSKPGGGDGEGESKKKGRRARSRRKENSAKRRGEKQKVEKEKIKEKERGRRRKLRKEREGEN